MTFCVCVHCEVITTVQLINISTQFFFVYCENPCDLLRKLQGYIIINSNHHAVIRCTKLIHPMIENLYPLTKNPIFCCPG